MLSVTGEERGHSNSPEATHKQAAYMCTCAAAVLLQRFDETELEFQEKILYRSGLGDETYIPPCECTHSTALHSTAQRSSAHLSSKWPSVTACAWHHTVCCPD